MKSSIILLAALLLVACKGGDEDEVAPETRTTRTRATAQTARKAIFPEPEAVAVLRALAEAGANTSRVAAEISQNEAVLAYARVLNTDYQGIGRLVDSIAYQTQTGPRDNAFSLRLRAGSDSVVQAFFAMTGGFNNTFIEEQIKAQRQAIAVLDTAVIPSLQSNSLKDLAVAIRPTLLAHLQRAMQILATRRREAAERGEAWVSGLPQPQDSSAAQPEPMPLPQAVPEPADTSAVPSSTTNM